MLGYLRQNVAGYLKANIAAYFFIILIFIIGVVIGSLAVKALPDEQKVELVGYLRVFFQGLKGDIGAGQEVALLQNILANNAKTIILMWLLGFTVVGIPFVLFIVFTRGFVIGFTVGFLINEYIMKGLAFAFVSVLPHNFFAVPAMIAAAVSAINFSVLLVRRKTRPKVNIFYQALGYTLFCLVMLALMIAAGVVEVYVSPVFMKLVASLLLKE